MTFKCSTSRLLASLSLKFLRVEVAPLHRIQKMKYSQCVGWMIFWKDAYFNVKWIHLTLVSRVRDVNWNNSLGDYFFLQSAHKKTRKTTTSWQRSSQPTERVIITGFIARTFMRSSNIKEKKKMREEESKSCELRFVQ